MFRAMWCRVRYFIKALLGLNTEGRGPTRDDIDEAKLLTDGLLLNVGTGERQYVSKKLDIYLADVEASVDSFDFQLQFVRRYDERFPCLVQSEAAPIPVTLEKLTGLFWILREARMEYEFGNLYSNLQRSWLEAIVRLYEHSGVRIQLFKYAEVIDHFRYGLERFLVTRFSARCSDISESPGLFFHVYTRSHGLRVHYSPSFFIEWRVLGSPTSPVGGWIQPGLYRFAAEGPHCRFTIDAASYEIPPRTEAHLFNV